MHGLGWADAEQDPQHLGAGDSLCQLRIEAGAALFDHGEMESGCVCDRLEMLLRRQVCVRAWDAGELAGGEIGDRLGERVAEVGILRGAAVPRPPARVHRQSHQVGEPPDPPCAGGFAARQRLEPIEVGGALALGLEVRVEKREMGELVLGVVMDVLRHVRVEHRDGRSKRRVPAAPWHLGVLDPGKLVVLLPEVRLQNLEGGKEAQDGGIAAGQGARVRHGPGRLLGEQRGADRAGSDRRPLQ